VLVDGKVLVTDQDVDISMSLSAQGERVRIWIEMMMTAAPAAEWFLDRDDLDQLPVGYVYDEQGQIAWHMAGTLKMRYGGRTVEEPIPTQNATSADKWTIIDKQDSIVVLGKEYGDIVKVERETVVPTFGLGSGETEHAIITYWVARGVGMVKGVGQYEMMGEPLAIELKKMSIEIAPPRTYSVDLVETVGSLQGRK